MNEERNKLNEYWTGVVTDYLSSGLTQKEYAQKNELKAYTLGYWIRKFNTGFNGFIQAIDTPLEKKEILTSSIEITVNKMKIVIKDYFDEDLLLKVIRTVRRL